MAALFRQEQEQRSANDVQLAIETTAEAKVPKEFKLCSFLN
jgi:hypothetical protein